VGTGIALDASAFIALLNPQDAHHSDAVQLAGLPQWDRGLFLHEVSLAESLVGAPDSHSADLLIRQVDRLRIHVIDSRGVSGAQRVASLRRTTRCSLPDCYVLDGAIENELVLGTFDQRMAQAAVKLGIDLPSR
jgi:predicted nucleic acid-binding protein